MKRALLRAEKPDHAVFHHRIPEVRRHAASRVLGIRLVRVCNPVVHETEAQLRDGVVGALALSEYTWLHIALTFPCPEEYIPAAALADHPFCDFMMLVFVPIAGKLRAVFVPLKMRPHLITAALEIGVVAQVVAAAVPDGTNPLDLRLDRAHDPHRVDDPDQRGFPVHRVQYALERLIGRNLVAALLPADAHDGVGKQTVFARHLKFDNVVVLRVFQTHTSQKVPFSPSIFSPV